MDRVVVRYGELGVKGPPVRRRMEERLRSNLEAAFDHRGVDWRFERREGRLVGVPSDEQDDVSDGSDISNVTVDADATTAAAEATGAAEAASVASALPGVVSASPAVAVDPDREAIYDAMVALATARAGSFDTYAVRASRARDDHDFTSPELEREGGTAVGEAVDAAVDLEDPDVTFEADVRPGVAYVFCERLAGPGGLPIGTQAPLVALVSGGIDSPVAAFEAMRRGSPVIPVYVDLGDFGGVDHRTRAIAACERLAARAPNFDGRPYVVDGGETLADLARRVERGRMLSLRRYFFAVAETIAAREDAAGIVTGEALGQKSSQTARNLEVTSSAVDLPVHRPLFSMDKPDITERARELGTYEEAEIPAGCNRLVPDRPETAGRLEALLAVEPDDLLARAEADARAARRVDVRG